MRRHHARMPMRGLLGLLFAAVAALAGCNEDLTEIVLVIDTDLEVPQEVDAVRLQVNGAMSGVQAFEGTTELGGDDAPEPPLAQSIVPTKGSVESVEVVLTALKGGETVVRQRRRADFVDGESRMLRIFLSGACRGANCEGSETCARGQCVPVEVQEELPPWEGQVIGIDAGIGGGDACVEEDERCNGQDDDCDGTVDEGIDLQSDVRNCGECGNNCRALDGVQAASCSGGSCTINRCRSRFGDCNDDGSDGCETNLADDIDNCGACGLTCSEACTGGFCSGDQVVALSAGSQHTCALRMGGEAVCWGLNRGRVGDGTTTTRRTPVSVEGLQNASAIAAGGSHSCALRDDGTGACWGDNTRGALGDGTTERRLTPANVQDLSDAVALAAGSGHSCAIMALDDGGGSGGGDAGMPDAGAEDAGTGEGGTGNSRPAGRVWCWGVNLSGQLGDGNTTDRQTTPVRAGDLETAVDVATGSSHSCAVLRDGTARCWGDNTNGQLGDGTTDDHGTPVEVQDLTDATAIAAGSSFTCALRGDGTVHCWGSNNNGQLGTGEDDSATAVPVVGIDDAIDLALGSAHGCAARSDGEVSCWGDNSKGQLGDGTTSQRDTPVAVAKLGSIVEVAAGNAHSCAARDTGAVVCWGLNNVGQVGNGRSVDNVLEPTSVIGLPFPK